jgi:hypothetical protein
VEAQGLVDVAHQGRVPRAGAVEAADEGVIDRAHAGEEHVAGDALGQRAGGTGELSGLHPRHEDELDEGERQQHQDERRAGQQHHDREQPAEVGAEDDVAEAERRHRDQRPVDRRRPAVHLALALHDHVEHRAEQGDHDHQQGQQEPQDAGVAAGLGGGEVAEDEPERLHRSTCPRKAIGQR